MFHVWVKSDSDETECQRRRRPSTIETDIELRKRGDQKGLVSPVVHAVNDDFCL